MILESLSRSRTSTFVSLFDKPATSIIALFKPQSYIKHLSRFWGNKNRTNIVTNQDADRDTDSPIGGAWGRGENLTSFLFLLDWRPYWKEMIEAVECLCICVVLVFGLRGDLCCKKICRKGGGLDRNSWTLLYTEEEVWLVPRLLWVKTILFSTLATSTNIFQQDILVIHVSKYLGIKRWNYTNEEKKLSSNVRLNSKFNLTQQTFYIQKIRTYTWLRFSAHSFQFWLVLVVREFGKQVKVSALL